MAFIKRRRRLFHIIFFLASKGGDDFSSLASLVAGVPQGLNSDLRKIFEWSCANLLRLNPAKFMVLLIYRRRLLGPLPSLFLGNVFISYVLGCPTKNIKIDFHFISYLTVEKRISPIG
jgi:hypothetical protein